MTVLKRINVVRRKLMKKFTQNIGNSQFKIKDPRSVKRVLISRPNHRLGNLLLITPLVQEVTDIFPNSKIDLFVKGGLGPIIFRNYENIDQIIQLPKQHFKELYKYLRSWTFLLSKKYDVVINVVSTSSSGRLSTKITNAENKFFGEIEKSSVGKPVDFRHIAKSPVYDLRNGLLQQGIPLNQTKEILFLNLKLDATEVVEGKKIIDSIVSKKKQTISIFTYATGKKIYPKEWWAEFHENLKKEFPSHNILEILPVENVSRIDFKEPSFYSKNIREMGAVIANTAIFIGADSGIMHLASSVHTPTIGLFRSRSEIYEPYGNKSMSFNTAERSIEELTGEIRKILMLN